MLRILFYKNLKLLFKKNLNKRRTRRVLKGGHKVALKASINRGRLLHRPPYRKIYKKTYKKIYGKKPHKKKTYKKKIYKKTLN